MDNNRPKLYWHGCNNQKVEKKCHKNCFKWRLEIRKFSSKFDHVIGALILLAHSIKGLNIIKLTQRLIRMFYLTAF